VPINPLSRSVAELFGRDVAITDRPEKFEAVTLGNLADYFEQFNLVLANYALTKKFQRHGIRHG